jgi:hypothetical protein
MAFALFYLDELETDVEEDKIWYKAQKEGLEIEFAIAIEKAIELILDTPGAFAIRYKNVRIAHPRDFPTIYTFSLINLKPQ